ncbi:MAG: hypothetical protein BWX60_00842 [Candidatus Marinimicrobia bacterium ADurb.Bin030]|nr:MAG: hypothetical protein BWX60_00842 [Candidatus Marinimicrobia bacterium ADurb.Bin030]
MSFKVFFKATISRAEARLVLRREIRRSRSPQCANISRNWRRILVLLYKNSTPSSRWFMAAGSRNGRISHLVNKRTPMGLTVWSMTSISVPCLSPLCIVWKISRLRRVKSSIRTVSSVARLRIEYICWRLVW